jgi:single stranded DNA-binding protein
VVANFSVAVDESYKDLLGEWHKKTEWHRVQVWEEFAQTVNSNLWRSMRVYVEGRRAIRNCTDRENGKHAYREIVASEVRFLDAGPNREARDSGEFIMDPALNCNQGTGGVDVGFPSCRYEESYGWSHRSEMTLP